MKQTFIEKIEYPAAIILLGQLHEEVVEDQSNEQVILTSHPQVITLGKRADIHEVTVSRWNRLFAGIGMFYTPRGGGATAHGPGQEVIYPVLSLERRGLSVTRYIEILADAAQTALKAAGVDAAWDPEHPGLYVKGKKIASVGLRVSRGVVSHGLSINITENPPAFDAIIPCKMAGMHVTSVKEITGTIPPPWAVGKAVVRELDRLI